MHRRCFLTHSLIAGAFATRLSAAPGPVPLGLNTYCLRALRWHDRQLLDYAGQLQMDAIFLQDSLDPRANDPAHWPEVRAQAVQLGLKLETGVGAILPKEAAAFDTTVQGLRQGIRRATAMGSPLVRAVLAADRERLPSGPVTQHMETTVKVVRAVRSELLDAGVKVALENHKDLQAWEMRQVIEAAGKDIAGSLLDTGNPMFVLEDPMTTLEELGPVALTVHLRDTVLYEHPRGVAVQWVPLGEGVVDFKAFVARMKEVCPPVAVYVKPITGRPPQVLPFLEPGFWDRYPQARSREFARFLALARRGLPYDKPMVIEDIPGRQTPEPFVAAVQHQQRKHMEEGIVYARKTLALGIRGRT